jgi:hypothetical protein
MANKKELREALATVFRHLRDHENTISSLLVEVASLRESLIELGPRYEEILSRHRARQARKAKQLAYEMLRAYDEKIQSLKDDDLL